MKSYLMAEVKQFKPGSRTHLVIKQMLLRPEVLQRCTRTSLEVMLTYHCQIFNWESKGRVKP